MLAAVVVSLCAPAPRAWSASSPYTPTFAPCEPESEFVGDASDPGPISGALSDPSNGLSLDQCAKWNPDFPFNGGRCCQKIVYRRRRHRGGRCSPQRYMKSFCEDITTEQKNYAEAVGAGKVDVLAQITNELGRKAPQAQCTPNNGFLVRGRPLVPTADNRVALRAPDRCTNYGTDGMVGMIEWLARQVKAHFPGQEYAGVKLVVGDISAPRGGCTGHASHRSGQDADIGFIWAKPDHGSPIDFHRDYDAKTNWWFLKQVLKNPYACVKVIFLDRKLIRKLDRVAHNDEDWQLYHRFIRHMPLHKNHHHVRIGSFPGQPGCVADAKPELEEEEEAAEIDGGLDFED